MKSSSAVSAYVQASYENAPPIKIVHMMYEGALRYLGQAQRLDPRAQLREFTDRLNRADAVVSELRLSLDDAHAPELCEQLTGLYRFVESQIREALLGQTSEPLEGACSVLQVLLEGWREIDVEDPQRSA